MNKKTFTRIDQMLLDYVVPLIVTFGIAIVIFIKATLISYPKSDTEYTFYSLSSGIDKYYGFETAWKTRLFSNSLAAFTAHASEWLAVKFNIPVVRNTFELTVGLWITGWFLLTCLILVWTFKRRSLFYVFGLYAGISFGYLERLRMAVRAYPWDMPALFFYTLFVLLFIQKKYWWVFAIIPLSVGFKETSLILALSFFFVDVPTKQRVGMVLGSAAFAVGVKIAIDWYTHGPLFFTMQTGLDMTTKDGLLFWTNIHMFNRLLLYFINAGTLLAFFILPITNKNTLYFKLLAIPFVLGIFLFGVLDEYRIWFEMIPFSLYVIDTAIYGDPINQIENFPV